MDPILFITDLHGNQHGYENAVKLARSRGLNTLILGGDLTPKKLAIKLNEKNDLLGEPEKKPEGDIDLGGGETIPLELVRESDDGSYTSCLEQILNLNRRFGTSEFSESLQKEGYIVHPIGNAFYNLVDMLEDQKATDTLMRFLALSPIMRTRNPLTFTSYQEEISFESMIETLRDVEASLTESQKATYAEQWCKSLSKRVTPFHELAPSVNLPIYMQLRDRLDGLAKVRDELKGKLKGVDEAVADYARSCIASMYDDAETAVRLVTGEYDAKLFGQLRKLSTIAELERNHRMDQNPNVYLAGQRRFLQEFFRKTLGSLSSSNANVYSILGNDDLIEVNEDIKNLGVKGHVYLDGTSVVNTGNLFIAGYPFVRSTGEGFYAAWQKPEDEIEKDLEKLATQSDPKNTIYVVHSPPHNTSLDLAFDGRHIGSKSIRGFIERHQPLMVLSGHIHESPEKSGKVMDLIGKTPCYNPGAKFGSKEFSGLIIDPEKPEKYERISEVT